MSTQGNSKGVMEYASYFLVPYVAYKLSSFHYYAANDEMDTLEWTPTQLLFAKAFIAALTSGLGGFPLYLVGELPEHVMGIAIIFAAGLMSGCSAVLFIEALEVESSITLVILYTFLGMMLVHMISHCVGDIEDFEFAGLKGQSATKALVIVLSMGLHSLGEGVESLSKPSLVCFSASFHIMYSLPIYVLVSLIHRFCNETVVFLYAFMVSITCCNPTSSRDSICQKGMFYVSQK